MDILLTDEEVVDARTDAEVAVWARHGDISEQIQAGTEAVLRAQVRKVYKFILTHWTHARQLDYHTAQDNTVQLTIKSEDWQALREAAGGER